MNPGELDQRVTLQEQGTTKNALNEQVDGWVNVLAAGDGKLWARVRDMTGRQFIAAAATKNAVMAEIRIRKRPGIAAKMRVLHRQDIYDIEAVLERDGRWLDLMCTRGQNNG
jgi:SPP1 family predicted phage head-tail adaptor